MKLLLILAGIMTSVTSFASAHTLQCVAKTKSFTIKEIVVKISNKQIIISEKNSIKKPTVWDLTDPGLYSYFADDANGVDEGSERSINQVRLDLDYSAKKVEQMAYGVSFNLEIAYSNYNITEDESYPLETVRAVCQRVQ